jgi:HTH-type transcriptional regulator/antitoxin HigA
VLHVNSPTRLREFAALYLDAEGPLLSRREYRRAVRALDAILDAIGEDERHPLADLAEALGVFIERYEEEHLELPEASAAEVLRFLMKQHGLRQADLPEVGSQGVVSEVLGGRRQLNARQVRALAARFAVSPAVFL